VAPLGPVGAHEKEEGATQGRRGRGAKQRLYDAGKKKSHSALQPVRGPTYLPYLPTNPGMPLVGSPRFGLASAVAGTVPPAAGRQEEGDQRKRTESSRSEPGFRVG